MYIEILLSCRHTYFLNIYIYIYKYLYIYIYIGLSWCSPGALLASPGLSGFSPGLSCALPVLSHAGLEPARFGIAPLNRNARADGLGAVGTGTVDHRSGQLCFGDSHVQP